MTLLSLAAVLIPPPDTSPVVSTIKDPLSRAEGGWGRISIYGFDDNDILVREGRKHLAFQLESSIDSFMELPNDSYCETHNIKGCEVIVR